jgi:hypothetical protein
VNALPVVVDVRRPPALRVVAVASTLTGREPPPDLPLVPTSGAAADGRPSFCRTPTLLRSGARGAAGRAPDRDGTRHVPGK